MGNPNRRHNTKMSNSSPPKDPANGEGGITEGLKDMDINAPERPEGRRYKSWKNGDIISHNFVPPGQSPYAFPPPPPQPLPAPAPVAQQNPSMLSAKSEAFIPKGPQAHRQHGNGMQYRRQHAQRRNAPPSQNLKLVQNVIQDIRQVSGPYPSKQFPPQQFTPQQFIPQHGGFAQPVGFQPQFVGHHPAPQYMGPGPHYNPIGPVVQVQHVQYPNHGPQYNGVQQMLPHARFAQSAPNGIRPPYTGARPPFNGPRPQSNGPRPPVNGARPPAPTANSKQQISIPVGLGPRNATAKHTVQRPLQPVASLPIRPPKVFLARRDKSYHDIIIRADGVERNLTKITETFPPSGGKPQVTCSDDYKPENYDFVADFNAMKEEEQIKLFKERHVEIFMDIKPENNEKDVSGKDENTPKKGDADKTADDSALAVTTVLDQLKRLGTKFTDNIKILHVTLNFLEAESTSAVSVITVHTGPKAAPPPPLENNGPLPSGPQYELLGKLVSTISMFPALDRLTVHLHVHSSPTGMPLSIDQLKMVLPFYDCAFTKWHVVWKNEFMTRPMTVDGWPYSWLDRERDRVLADRARIEEAVYVRKSVAPF